MAMHSGTTSIEWPTGGGTPTDHIDGEPLQNTADSDKAFASLEAQFTVQRHALHRTHANANDESADLTRLIAHYHNGLTAVAGSYTDFIVVWANAMVRAGARLSAAQVATRMAPSAESS